MTIWLRNARSEADPGVHGVGIGDDVLRHEQFASVVELDERFADVDRRCDALLESAEQQARALVDHARATADALVADAGRDFDRAAQRGYDEGLQRALGDWHARGLDAAHGAQALQVRLREQLARLVATAVEQIVLAQEPGALFAKALSAVDRIVAEGSPVTLRVHPDDAAAARAELERCACAWGAAGRTIRPAVLQDAVLARGSCVCETDLGVFDASLPVQLAALHSALERAMRSMAAIDADGTDGDGDTESQDLQPDSGNPSAAVEPDHVQ